MGDRLSDAFACVVEKRLLRGEYAPGAYLPPLRTLSTETGIGRSVASQGLERLTERGYLEALPRQGFRVLDWRMRCGVSIVARMFELDVYDRPMIADLISSGERLVKRCVGLAASCARPEKLARLREAQASLECANPQDARGLARADYALLHALFDASGNFVYPLYLSDAKLPAMCLLEIYYRLGEPLRRSFSAKADLVSHILAQEPENACRALDDVLDQTRGCVHRFLRTDR